MRKLTLIALSVFLISGVEFEHHHEHDCQGFAPENNAYIPVQGFEQTGITEEVFHMVLDRIDLLFAPKIEALGGRLVIERKWKDGTVNAYAQRIGQTYRISMFGGLARHVEVNPLAFAAVACHEIGHHIGGFPRKNNNTRWAATEGQSDYYATLKCLREFVEGVSDEELAAFEMDEWDINPVAEARCDQIHWDLFNRLYCYYGAVAGQSLANLLADLGRSPMPNFETPSTKQVTRTFENHPQAQCRLDTYFHGALCDKSILESVNDDDHMMGTCNRAEGYSEGIRPLCWYRPPEA